MRMQREARSSSPPHDEDRSITPPKDEIAMRAHELYVERGASDGHDLRDWLDAEQQLAREKRRRSDDESAPPQNE